jgi:hypothetical protein
MRPCCNLDIRLLASPPQFCLLCHTRLLEVSIWDPASTYPSPNEQQDCHFSRCISKCIGLLTVLLVKSCSALRWVGLNVRHCVNTVESRISEQSHRLRKRGIYRVCIDPEDNLFCRSCSLLVALGRNIWSLSCRNKSGFAATGDPDFH